MLVACVGAFGRLGLRRLDGLLLGAAIAVGVLASDAYLYHYTTMAPQQRFDELRQIDARFAGKGPTLTPDFDEYTLYLLRDMAPDAPGNSRKVRPWATPDGQFFPYGVTIDVDMLDMRLVEQTPTIVVRRSPFKSRPPGNFALAWRGADYEVWKRTSAPAPREHLALGAGTSAGRGGCVPGGAEARRPRSRAGRAAAALRAAHAQRGAPAHARATVDACRAPARRLDRVHRARVGDARASLSRVPAATGYGSEGNTGRALQATVDGRPAGTVTSDSGGDGNVLQFDTVALSVGPHVVRFARGGGNLGPGDAALTNIRAIALEPVADEAHAVRSVPIGDWRTLCGRQLDWVETV